MRTFEAEMRHLSLIALLLAACASAPRGPADTTARAVYDGYAIEEVRATVVEVLSELGRGMDPARITSDGRVVAEYDGLADFEVRFAELDGAVAAELEIEPTPRLSCHTRRTSPGGSHPMARTVPVVLEGGQVERVSGAVAYGSRLASADHCTDRSSRWTGKSAAEILEGIRARLDDPVAGAQLEGL